MDRHALNALLAAVPYAWREDIAGYTRSVAEAAPAIYDELSLTEDDVPVVDFLGGVTAWRVWSKIDALHWLLSDSLTIAREQGLEGFAVGSARYTRGSGPEQDLSALRTGIRRTFTDAGAQHLLQAKGPKDVLAGMAES